MNIEIPSGINSQVEILKENNQIITDKLNEVNETLSNLNVPYISGNIIKSVTAVRVALDSILLKKCQVITIHPWIYEVEQNIRGKYSDHNLGYLTMDEALNFLSKKLTDQMDSGRENAKELIYILISSYTLKGFITILEAFNNVLEIGDLPLCERRAKQLDGLELEKMIIKKSFLNPHLKECTNQSIKKINKLTEVTENLLAISESYSSEAIPIEELMKVVQSKINGISISQNAYDSFKKLFTSSIDGNIKAAYLTGSSYSLSQQLEVGGVNVENKYTAIVGLIGNKIGDLKNFKEAFNL